MKKISLKTPLFFTILFLLLYSSFCSAPPKKIETPLYQGQQTVLALDQAHTWARKNRADSVFQIEMRGYADIQVFSDKKKTGKPIFHLRKLVTKSSGSGVVISNSGYVLTAKHVVDNGESLKEATKVNTDFQRDNPGIFVGVKIIMEYTLIDSLGKKFPAFVVATGKNDLALVRAKDKKGFTAPAIEMSHETILSDRSVIVIGTPLGIAKDIIMDGRIGRQKFETDETGNVYSYVIAPVVPGNSGGPVLTLSDMKIVGIIDEILMNGQSLTSMGLMVPNTVINKFLEKSLPKK